MASSSSNPSLLNFTHDIFVNYRHEDTGNNFTSHLKSAFAREGFNVAMNDMIGKGIEISDTLMSKISESLVSVVIFSKSYASSPDCLDELVKIIKSKEENGRYVMPVFLGVRPSDVGKQTGTFGDGFHGLIQSEQFKEKKETWTSVLMKTANLSGWDSMEKSEAKIVEGIVDCIMKTLERLPSGNSSNDFVGIYQVKAVESMLQLQSKINVQFLGIWGMGGIGKTRISKEVFHRISNLFDASCYLENVTQMLKRKGLQSLTKKMLSQLGIVWNPSISHSAQRALKNRRVLIILDDVSNYPRLKSLVKEDLSYGPGSRVILICRDKQVLKSYQCEDLYQVEKLNGCESRKLFGFHAFKEQTCPEMYRRLLKKALFYCGGLPLALEVLGCNLCDKNFKEWESELAKLENIPNQTVNDVIRISYEGLDENEKRTFLDIACVFHGWDEARVKRILDACGLYAVSGISRLRDKALISTSYFGELRMHNLIQQLGQDIVFCECKEEPGNRSRLWRFEDFSHMVEQNTGSEKVQAISVNLSKATTDMYMMPEFFEKMFQLRVLNLHDKHFFRGNQSGGIKLRLPKGLTTLSNKLRYLCWDCYPLTSFPEKFTLANHLVELRLRGSNVKQLWIEGAEPHLPMLKRMDLSRSKDLINLPDFSKTPNLKALIAQDCHKLIEIPSSIQHLSKLQTLHMGECVNLKKLPVLPPSIVSLNFGSTKIKELPSWIGSLSQLQRLNLERCQKLRSLPESFGDLKCLGFLLLNYCLSLTSLPQSLGNLLSLKYLHTRQCENLKFLPGLPSSLEVLDANGCTSLKIEGDVFGSSLIKIFLRKTGVESLPESIKHLSLLNVLDLSDCKNLKFLPGLPSSLQALDANGCTSLRIECDVFGLSLIRISLSETDVESLPESIKHLSHLKVLDLSDCKNLKYLPELPSSLAELNANGCTSLRIEGDVFGLSLIRISLCETDVESLPESIKNLSCLYELDLRDCKNLKSLPDLPSSLEVLNANGCTSLTTVGNFFGEDRRGRYLEFNLAGCFNLDQNSKIRSLVKAQARLKALPTIMSYRYRGRMGLCIPGSEVPNWFKYKEDGSSIKLKLVEGKLVDESELAFCFAIDNCSNIKKKISSGVAGLYAECNCLFVTEIGEYRYVSVCCRRRLICDIDSKSEHVFLWADTHRFPLVRFSKAKFKFEAHIEYKSDSKENKPMASTRCNIIQCGVSPLGKWETYMGEGSQSELEVEGGSQSESEEAEEPSPKRLKCHQFLTS